jgi:hypothetical protein
VRKFESSSFAGEDEIWKVKERVKVIYICRREHSYNPDNKIRHKSRMIGGAQAAAGARA